MELPKEILSRPPLHRLFRFRSEAAPRSQRATCLACRKSDKTCYCGQIARVGRVESKIDFVILQHPKEARHLIGTGRLAHLALKHSRLLCGIDFTEHTELNSLLEDPRRRCAILYPGKNSVNVRVAIQETPCDRQLTLIVLDGTWGSVRPILRLSKNLHSLPRLSFSVERPSAYAGVRHQPRPDCLSTVEAIARVVEEVDGPGEAEKLMTPFLWMVQQQLDFGENSTVRTEGARVRLDDPSSSLK